MEVFCRASKLQRTGVLLQKRMNWAIYLVPGFSGENIDYSRP